MLQGLPFQILLDLQIGILIRQGSCSSDHGPGGGADGRSLADYFPHIMADDYADGGTDDGSRGATQQGCFRPSGTTLPHSVLFDRRS